MQYRLLGQTGLMVSALGFGSSALGGVYGTTDDREAIAAVHAAWDAGITYFDSSPYYGLTRAETVLGKALRTLPRDRLVLSTKAGRYGEHAFDMSASRLTASIDESLRRLQTDYVDILFLHDIEFVPLQQIVDESLPALEKLREQGKIRFVGVSGLPLTALTRTLDAHALDVVLSYCHYTLLDWTLTTLLPRLEADGVGIVNASPFAMGLLTRAGPPAWHPASPRLREHVRTVADAWAQRGRTLEELAIQFAVQEPRIASTLFSTADPRQVEQTVRWAERPVDPDALREILAALLPVHNETWPSGLDEYAPTPRRKDSPR